MVSPVEQPKSILVIKLKNIGDCILLTPVLKVLKKHFPQARISLLLRAGTDELLRGSPHIDEIFLLYGGGTFFFALPRLSDELRLMACLRRKRFDLGIDLSGGGDRSAFWLLAGGCKVRLGFTDYARGPVKKMIYNSLTSALPPGSRPHEIERNLSILKPLGIREGYSRPEVFISSEEDEWAKNFLAGHGIDNNQPPVLVHPTARWLFKCWTDKGMAEVIDYLMERRGCRVVVTSGREDRETEKVRKILSLAKSKPLDLSGQLSLRQLAALLTNSRLFVGVDSAPMHLASAVGTPTISLFGPTGWQDWAPRGEKDIVIHRNLACQPCGRDGCEGSKKSRCLDDITPREVMDAIDRQLRDGRN